MNEVVLNGGLGNQLFQLAFLLHQSSEKPLILNPNLGLPRKNKNGEPDIAILIQNLPVAVAPCKKPNIIHRKLSTLAIRESAKNQGFSTLIKFLEIAYTIIFSVSYGHFRRVKINSGIGFDTRLEAKFDCLNFGYFQTFRWASEPGVLELLSKLRPTEYSIEFSEFIKSYSNKRILCVHVRLTDYKLENSFGVPSKSYYQKAINLAASLEGFEKIWLFSDEPGEALGYIPLEFQEILEVVPEFPGGVSETFELMRHCHSYVIGNSTFSWWGAFLSYNKNPNVIAPSKWFSMADTPLDLIPEAWHKIDPHFKVNKD